MVKLKEGYAVGGDDTQWRKYISDRILELDDDIKATGNVTPKSADTDNLSQFHNKVQKLLGGIKI